MLPVLIAGMWKVQVEVNQGTCSPFQRVGDHVVMFDAPVGTMFKACGRRFTVADSQDHEGGGLLIKNAVPHNRRRKNTPAMFTREQRDARRCEGRELR